MPACSIIVMECSSGRSDAGASIALFLMCEGGWIVDTGGFVVWIGTCDVVHDE